MATDLPVDFARLAISHAPVAGGDQWAAALDGKHPGPFEFTKFLVLKPKAKGDVVPIAVVALATSSTPGNAVAKAAGAKEARMAAADLVEQVFAKKPEDVGLLDITSDNASRVKVVLDKALRDNADRLVAVRAGSSDKTAIVEAGAVVKHLESTGVEIIDVDFAAAASTPSTPKPAVAKTSAVSAAALDGAALIGITVDKELDFPGWYQQVLTKAEMLDYYDVSGCYILRPNSYSIWERIQRFFDDRIKTLGVKNAYFPMFVSSRVLEREKDHIEGFAPEVAWVTRAGQSELEEPIAIRPTSETVMYPYYAKWIRSHRDLPLRLNQWNSVVRWEFKHPQPFLRTREFLWQEGHTAHLTFESANQEVLQILDWYADIYEQLLAVPVIKGRKTEKEKFAGALFTTTCEGYIPTTGRGIQGATSHALGQNFSKMFNISVENPEGADKPKLFAWQNSWGLSTRVIGVMVMVHSDNKGLVLPPRVADTQVMAIPVGLTAKTSPADKKAIEDGVADIVAQLKAAGVRADGDYRSYTPGWKFADAELHGTPLRIEYGPMDAKKQQVVAVRRDNGAKTVIPLANLATEIPALLETMQADMYAKAKQAYDSHISEVTELSEMTPLLNKKHVLLAPFCGEESCEDAIKDATARRDDDEEVDEKAPSMGAKSLCMPFDQKPLADGTKCVGACGRVAKAWTLFGRSY